MSNATNSALIAKLSTLAHLFVTQRMNNLTLCVLNHIARVGFKRHYFSICCRATASMAFRCDAILKKRPCEFFFISNNSLVLLILENIHLLKQFNLTLRLKISLSMWVNALLNLGIVVRAWKCERRFKDLLSVDVKLGDETLNAKDIISLLTNCVNMVALSYAFLEIIHLLANECLSNVVLFMLVYYS